MFGGIMRIMICLAIGAVFGWFAGTEWEKVHKDEWKLVKAQTKKLVTKNDIRVVDWRGKK